MKGGPEMSITLYHGDILDVEAEVLVNPANTNLQHGGGLAAALVKAGGRSIQDESDAIGGCDLGSAVATGAGALRARHVIHVPTVDYRASRRAAPEDISTGTREALQLAQSLSARSIAFPLLGAGIAGLGAADVARAMALVMAEFDDLQITICVHWQGDLGAVQQVLQALPGPPAPPSPENGQKGREAALRVWRIATGKPAVGAMAGSSVGILLPKRLSRRQFRIVSMFKALERLGIGKLLPKRFSRHESRVPQVFAYLEREYGIATIGLDRRPCPLCSDVASPGIEMLFHWNDEHLLGFEETAALAERMPEMVFKDAASEASSARSAGGSGPDG